MARQMNLLNVVVTLLGIMITAVTGVALAVWLLPSNQMRWLVEDSDAVRDEAMIASIVGAAIILFGGAAVAALGFTKTGKALKKRLQ